MELCPPGPPEEKSPIIYGHRRQPAMRSRPEKSSSITITGRPSGLKASPRLASPSARDQGTPLSPESVTKCLVEHRGHLIKGKKRATHLLITWFRVSRRRNQMTKCEHTGQSAESTALCVKKLIQSSLLIHLILLQINRVPAESSQVKRAVFHSLKTKYSSWDGSEATRLETGSKSPRRDQI